jgi:hypothetical protein
MIKIPAKIKILAKIKITTKNKIRTKVARSPKRTLSILVL